MISLKANSYQFMKITITTILFISCSFSHLIAATEFEDPVRLKAGGKPIQVVSPGYAAPCLADIDGDGKKELLVGQFHGGRISVYKHKEGIEFEKGKLLMAGGKVAEVAGMG